jgi:hypothetical protein
MVPKTPAKAQNKPRPEKTPVHKKGRKTPEWPQATRP